MVLSRTQTLFLPRAMARAACIALFAAFTGLAARITIPLPYTPIPFTLQVFVVLLAGLTLGARGGALSQIVYVSAITVGLPLDARMLGPAVWLTPTAGFLIGFVAAAFVVGWISERRTGKIRVSPLLAALAGIPCLYFFGVLWLTVFFLRGDVVNGLMSGAAPFLVVDSLKAIMAAAATGASQQALQYFSGGWHGIRG